MLTSLTKRLQQHEDQVFLVLTLMIGATVGLAVVAFIEVTGNLGARMYPPGAPPWTRLVVPVAGALVSGFLLSKYFPFARGSGIPQTKAALFVRDGKILARTVAGKFLCCSISLASGITLGREGPAVQVGAGIASVVGRRLGLSAEKVKALIPVGAAAAVAAAFNTPIAGVLFALEEILGDLHAPVLGSVVLSSATAWMVLHLFLGDEPLFHVPAYQLVHWTEFGVYAVLGVAGGVLSATFVKLLLAIREWFQRQPRWTEWFQPAAGGLMVGLMAWFVPESLGVGYQYVGQALNGEMAVKGMALLGVLRLISTPFCYGSGNAGGIFGPSLFLGAMLGGTVGGVAHALFPNSTATPGVYALVGMGTSFAGILRVPLTSVFMIFEITRDYAIIVPLMISNLISYYVSYRLQRIPIYEALAKQDGVHLPEHAHSRGGALRVAQAMQTGAEAFPSQMDAAAAREAMQKLEVRSWPVRVPEGLVGMVTAEQLEAADGRKLYEIVPALTGDARAEDFPHVHTDHGLDLVLQRMGVARLDVLPVVGRDQVRRMVGVVKLGDVLRVYGVRS